MEALEHDTADAEEIAEAEMTTEGAIAPEMAETADSTTQPTTEVEADAPAAAEADVATLTEPPQPTLDAPLELVELELALSLADIPAAGFDVALRAALASTGGTLLFIMPTGGGDLSVAALSLGSGDGRETFLAILGADGESIRFENAVDSRHPVAGLAASWTRVMERMPVAA